MPFSHPLCQTPNCRTYSGNTVLLLLHLSPISEYRLEDANADSEPCIGFTTTDIALAFIAAMAQQSFEPFDDRVSYFEYTHTETPVRIVLRSAPNAPTAMTVRSNIMWALKQLPIDLFHSPSIWGLDFKVQLSGGDLYLGKLSNKHRPGEVLVERGAQGGNSNLDVSGQKQNRTLLLITQPSNTTAQTLTMIPGPNRANTQYDLRVRFAGQPLPDIGIFSTILEVLLSLGALGPYQEIKAASLARDTLPVWVYVVHDAEQGSTQGLQAYQVVAILQATAIYCVERRIYQELIFNLLADEMLVAAGCVVRGLGGREWCRGLEGWGDGGGLGIKGVDVSQNVSVLA